MSIQKRRLKKGWSQEDLARYSGLSSRTIQRVESGQTIGSESLKCLAAVFETSSDIITREQDMNISKDKSAQARFNRKEKEAIKFGQTLLKEPKQGETDPLNKFERNAINYGKSLLNKLKT
jgi:transcriptional regulator with XRE-family HTH domain